MTLAAIGAEARAILGGSAEFFWAHRRWFLLAWGLTLVVTVVIYPSDRELLARVQAAGAGTEALAVWLSTIGRFENSSLAFAVILAVAGVVGSRDSLKRAAVACLLAGIVGGIGVNVLRPTFGRSRPPATVEPGFHWFEIEAQMHSMPSGHATSNAASAAAVATVVPALAPVAGLYAVGVAWSRLQLNRHYPTDVIWGLVLGGSVGIAVGASVRTRAARAGPGAP